LATEFTGDAEKCPFNLKVIPAFKVVKEIHISQAKACGYNYKGNYIEAY
jgi:hypothetical protein